MSRHNRMAGMTGAGAAPAARPSRGMPGMGGAPHQPQVPAAPAIPPVDPDERQRAYAHLEVGRVVQYTEKIMGDRPEDNERRAHPMVRAGIVIYIHDDGQGNVRPVLRVHVPNRPMLAAMPDEGLPMPADGLADLEIYFPDFHPDETIENTWRPVPAAAWDGDAPLAAPAPPSVVG